MHLTLAEPWTLTLSIDLFLAKQISNRVSYSGRGLCVTNGIRQDAVALLLFLQ